MVRSKIPITWIKSDASRHVTFTKRKKGLKKKVEELAILCGVEVCMICFGPQAGKTSSTPYSWGLPGVAHVINKYRSLSKEEQDKKKLDNTSLLEQQIKKLKTELKLKTEQNCQLENERACYLWDDRLNGLTADELKELANVVLDRTREVYDRISYISQQQQEVHQGFGSCTFDQHAGTLVADSNTAGDFDGQLSHELMMSSQGPYQQLVANLNSYNNPVENPLSAMGGLMNASTQSYHHGLMNQIPLLGLPAFIDNQKANTSTLPLNHSVPSASGNFYLNANMMLPSSADASYILNLKMKEPEQPHISSDALHPTLFNTTIYDMIEPHMLSNMTWQQAVGLQPDHQYADENAGSQLPQEINQATGEHQAEDAKWSGDNVVDTEVADRGEKEPFDASTQSMSIDNGQGGLNSGQLLRVTSAQFPDVSIINSAHPTILQLDMGQLAVMNNERGDLAAHQDKVREGMFMWSLQQEENNQMNDVYQSHMIADEDGTSLDKGLVDLENDVQVTEKSNATRKPALLDDDEDVGMASDVRVTSY